VDHVRDTRCLGAGPLDIERGHSDVLLSRSWSLFAGPSVANDALLDAFGCEMSTYAESNRSCVNRIQLADSVGPMQTD
jgi:hypothetical protein